MIDRKAIIFIVLILSQIGIVDALTQYNITNDATVYEGSPNTVLGNTPSTIFEINNYDIVFTGSPWTEYMYLDLGTTQPGTLYLYCGDSYLGCNAGTMNLLFWSTSIFDENTLTWNNQPYSIDLLLDDTRAYSSGGGWYAYVFPTTQSRYIVGQMLGGDQQYFVSGDTIRSESLTRKPYFMYTAPPTTFIASGNVKFQDVNGSQFNLNNALVKYNESLYNYTDSSGSYSIELPLGATRTLTVSYNQAMSEETGTVSEGSPTRNFVLDYSKGTLSAPILDGNKIKTTYSNNIASVNIWTFPNFVWGAVRYDRFINTSYDAIYYYAAASLGGSDFGLNVEYGKGGYTIYFMSSDFYNYPTNGWNPVINEYRYFNSTSYYYDEEDEILSGKTSNKTQSVRESELKNNAEIVIPFLLFVILLLAFATKIKERRF